MCLMLVYDLFYICGLVLWIDLRKGLYMRSVFKCAFAYDSVFKCAFAYDRV